MKKVMMFAAIVAVVSLASCKKKTCTLDGYTCCSSCTKLEADACKAGGYSCK